MLIAEDVSDLLTVNITKWVETLIRYVYWPTTLRLIADAEQGFGVDELLNRSC